MLTLTHEAADAIRRLTESYAADGVRIHAGSRFERGRGRQVQIEMARAPDVDDTVLEAAGARLFLESESLRELDDKVLDAHDEAGEPHFAVLRQA